MKEREYDILQFLSDGKWHKAKEIIEKVRVSGRTIRKVSEDTQKIISNSQDGYKLLALATDAEIDHHINDLRARCFKMFERVRAVQAFREEKQRKVQQPDMFFNPLDNQIGWDR